MDTQPGSVPFGSGAPVAMPGTAASLSCGCSASFGRCGTTLMAWAYEKPEQFLDFSFCRPARPVVVLRDLPADVPAPDTGISDARSEPGRGFHEHSAAISGAATGGYQQRIRRFAGSHRHQRPPALLPVLQREK